MASRSIGGSVSFSPAQVDSLTSTTYTLVSILVDMSGSISGSEQQIENAVRMTLEASRSARDNVLVQISQFNDNYHNIFNDYTELGVILENMNQLSGIFMPGGGTNMFPSIEKDFVQIERKAGEMANLDYLVNGLFILITDGEDTSGGSLATCRKIVDRFRDPANEKRSMESVRFILVEVGGSVQSLDRIVNDLNFQKGIDQRVSLNNADTQTMKALAEFMSKSVKAQSAAIGTGGPSQAVAFGSATF
jgi:uncharacterized protein YegL